MTADTIDFGQAIRLLKQGARMQRRGWNGKGMYLVYVPSTIGTMVELNDGQPIEIMPWIGMKTADNRFVPWLASQSDVLAEDWCVVMAPHLLTHSECLHHDPSGLLIAVVTSPSSAVAR